MFLAWVPIPSLENTSFDSLISRIVVHPHHMLQQTLLTQSHWHMGMPNLHGFIKLIIYVQSRSFASLNRWKWSKTPQLSAILNVSGCSSGWRVLKYPGGFDGVHCKAIQYLWNLEIHSASAELTLLSKNRLKCLQSPYAPNRERANKTNTVVKCFQAGLESLTLVLVFFKLLVLLY